MTTPRQIKKLLSRLLILLIPFALWFVVELFVLPIDYFTFRVWETLLVKDVKVLPGPFYPNQKIHKTEAGELAPHTKWAIEQEVTWYTDQYGYRNRPEHQDPDIVIVGDSNITGVKLTQDSTLSEVLENILDTCVYSFAPAHINRYLAASRFKEDPPQIVVFSSIERMIISLARVEKENIKSQLRAAVGPVVVSSDLLSTMAITMDRILKWPAYHFVRARIFTDTDLPYHNDGQFFLQGDRAVRDISPERFQRAVEVITNYKKVIEARGARFIFLPIPEKENIYHDLLPSRKKPTFLPELIKVLQAKGVEVVDIQPEFERIYNNGGLVFFKDDAHWNEKGVKIAAKMLAKQITLKKTSSTAITSKTIVNKKAEKGR